MENCVQTIFQRKEKSLSLKMFDCLKLSLVYRSAHFKKQFKRNFKRRSIKRCKTKVYLRYYLVFTDVNFFPIFNFSSQTFPLFLFKRIRIYSPAVAHSNTISDFWTDSIKLIHKTFIWNIKEHCEFSFRLVETELQTSRK